MSTSCLGPCRLSLVVSHLRTPILKCLNYLLWFYFLTDSEFSCLAMLAKPYHVSGPTYLPLIPNQLHCMSNCAHEVLGTICGARLMPVFTIKSIVLFIHDGSFVFRAALFIVQLLFVTHVLMWKDSILISFGSGACIALPYFLVDFILYWGKASRFSPSKTRNTHSIG